MSALLVVGILILNFGISWLNCWVCGSMKAESKQMGGSLLFLYWCGIVQAVVGFSSFFLILFTYLAVAFKFLPPEMIKYVASIWYLLVIFPALGTGIWITVHSIREALRTRSLVDGGIATWNTLATIHNVSSAVENIPSAWEDVGELFKEVDDAKVAIVLFLALASIGSGFFLTYILVNKYAHKNSTIPLYNDDGTVKA